MKNKNTLLTAALLAGAGLISLQSAQAQHPPQSPPARRCGTP